MRSKPGSVFASRILIGWVIFLAFAYATLSIVRHNRFESGGFDLGLYDQAVWQYSQFLWPYNTVKDRFILGDHLTLTLPLLAPLYWLWSDVKMLLIFQAVWITVSAIAIYKLSLLRKFSSFTALVVTLLYSLFYGIQYAMFFDFHPVVLGVGLAAWFVYFFEARKKFLVCVSLVLLLLTQENMGLLLASLGLIYLFHKNYRFSAVFFIVGGVFASLLASKGITFFSPIGFQYWPQLPKNAAQLIAQFFDNAQKRQVWLYSLSWFSFLPLLSPGAMLAMFFDLGQYFVTGPEFSRMWSPFMHHRITLAPLLTLGTLDGLHYLKQKKINITMVSLSLLAIALFLQFFFHLPLNKLSKSTFWKQEIWMADNRALIANVPPDARLATAQNLIPHVSHRQFVYLAWPRQHDFDTRPCGEKSCWWLDFDKNAQYLLVDLHPNQWITQILETNENFSAAVHTMEKMGKITLEQSVGAASLYRIH